MRPALALAIGALSTACSGALAKGDGRAFGDDLGRFHVAAVMDSSTCGPGAMDAPEHWQFDVVLSHLAPHLYWNTGADAVEGTLAADGKTFAMTSETVVNVGGSPTSGPTCAVVRDDNAAGELDAPKAPQHFTGTLEYDFAQQGRSDCSSLLVSGGFAALPCRMAYRLSGTWASAR
jgi:hypothetical protein